MFSSGRDEEGIADAGPATGVCGGEKQRRNARDVVKLVWAWCLCEKARFPLMLTSAAFYLRVHACPRLNCNDTPF